MRNLCRFTIPIIGIAVSLAGIRSAAAQQPPIIPPQIVSSGDVSIQEGDFSNPNFTLFNPNSVPVMFGGSPFCSLV